SPPQTYHLSLHDALPILDGTTNFLHGYPQYAVSIGCLVDGKLAAGVIHDVCRNRTYKAIRGGGAFEEDTRLSVSAVTEPRRALRSEEHTSELQSRVDLVC